jgi:glutaredoxin 3
VISFWQSEGERTSSAFTDDGDFIKAVLTRLTGRGTFPNVILRGKSIGGADDISAMHKEGHLHPVFEMAGLKVRAELRDEHA